MTASSIAKPGLIRRLRAASAPWLTFLRGFARHPVMVGSVVPSSDRLIERMLRPVDWKNCRVFVEYGPGVGTFCRPILKLMRADAVLVAIDTNPEFIAFLAEDIADPRFIPVLGSAADVERILNEKRLGKADFILSGLPFSTLPPGIGERIAAATARALRPGGAFLVYQFSPKVRSFIAPHFGRIDHGFEAWNVPPAQLYWAWKGAESVPAEAEVQAA